MIGVTLKDKRTNEWIRKETKVIDNMHRIASLKWNCAGHRKDGRMAYKERRAHPAVDIKMATKRRRRTNP